MSQKGRKEREREIWMVGWSEGEERGEEILGRKKDEDPERREEGERRGRTSRRKRRKRERRQGRKMMNET